MEVPAYRIRDHPVGSGKSDEILAARPLLQEGYLHYYSHGAVCGSPPRRFNQYLRTGSREAHHVGGVPCGHIEGDKTRRVPVLRQS